VPSIRFAIVSFVSGRQNVRVARRRPRTAERNPRPGTIVYGRRGLLLRPNLTKRTAWPLVMRLRAIGRSLMVQVLRCPDRTEAHSFSDGDMLMSAATSTVLIVDDDRSIRDLLNMALEQEGYTVVEAADGAQAVKLLEQHQPPSAQLCLVLLDMMLPNGDGVDVLHHLASLGAYVPVVAMSASSLHLQAALAAGARATLPKPFDLDGLMDAVQRNCPH
jgi:CheY-like chemotaxis protein